MLDVCDIWRIRNPKIKGFTFRQKNFQVLFSEDWTIFLFHKISKNQLVKLKYLTLFHPTTLLFFVLFEAIYKVSKNDQDYGNSIIRCFKMGNT